MKSKDIQLHYPIENTFLMDSQNPDFWAGVASALYSVFAICLLTQAVLSSPQSQLVHVSQPF